MDEDKKEVEPTTDTPTEPTPETEPAESKEE